MNDYSSDKYVDVRRQFSTKPLSFRESHHLIGEMVKLAEKENMPLDEFIRVFISKKAADEVFDLDKAMKKRNLIGMPDTRQVKKQLKRWKKTLSERPNRPRPSFSGRMD